MTPEGTLGPGQRVLLRGEAWTIVDRLGFAGCESLRLAGEGAGNAGLIRTFLTPFDRPRQRGSETTVRVVRPLRWLHEVRRLAADAHPFGGLRTAHGSAVQLLPYQLEPALAFVRRGASRVMIADAVGLGKTIQAGFLLTELASGGNALRAIVIVPAGLRAQWAHELMERFSLASTIADTAWLTQIGRELPRDVNPWALPGIYIASFDFLRRPEVLQPIEDVTWDAAVVDEAHGATAGTARRAAVHAIALRSRRVVLLTATPHGGDSGQFAALCRIGQAGARDEPLVIFRRTHAERGEHLPRRSVLLRVRPTEAERRMHRLLERYTGRVGKEARGRGDPKARLAVVVLRKRALSSAASLAASARTRMALLGGERLSLARQLVLPLADDEIQDDEPDSLLAAPGLADSNRERRWLEAIVSVSTEAARCESKIGFLLRFLARVREPVVIFTEYRDTLMRLEGALSSAGHRTTLLHGGLGPSEREEAQRAFNNGGTLLLATDAASEGLNLHYRCRTVVHFELPWSPSRLEQRTGRVDRIGQLFRVHEVLLVADDTAERLVLAPLVRRAARARASVVGSSQLLHLLTESSVTSAVMDGRSLDGSPPAISGRALDNIAHQAPADLRLEAQTEVARLAIHREWQARSPRLPGPGGIVVTALSGRPGGLAPGIICIYALKLSGSDGSVVHIETIAVREPWRPGSSSRSRRDSRQTAEEFVDGRDPAVRAAILTGYRDRLETVGRALGTIDTALDSRERAIAALRPSAARELVQAGLFDGRAARAAATRRSAEAERLDETDARIKTRSAGRQLTLSVDLRALLLIPPTPGGR